MKVFVLSLILLALAISLVLINVCYVKRTTDTLLLLADEVHADPSQKTVGRLSEYWDEHRSTLALSVSLRDIDSVTESLLNLQTASLEKNEWLIEQSYALFRNALEDIRRYETLSIINIF